MNIHGMKTKSKFLFIPMKISDSRINTCLPWPRRKCVTKRPLLDPGSSSHSSNFYPQIPLYLHRQIEFLPLQHPIPHTNLISLNPKIPQNPHSLPSTTKKTKKRINLLRIINPKEIRIQHRLHNPRHPRDLIRIPLREVSVEPVRDVKRAVETEREEIVCGYCFGFAGALEHEELGEDGDGFEPDGEGPEDLLGGGGGC